MCWDLFQFCVKPCYFPRSLLTRIFKWLQNSLLLHVIFYLYNNLLSLFLPHIMVLYMHHTISGTGKNIIDIYWQMRKHRYEQSEPGVRLSCISSLSFSEQFWSGSPYVSHLKYLLISLPVRTLISIVELHYVFKKPWVLRNNMSLYVLGMS